MVRQIMKRAALSLAKRESLESSQFAVPTSKARRLGVAGEIQGEAKGKYPVDTLKRARNALARVSQFGTPGERVAVRNKVYSRYPNLRTGFEERHGESPVAKKNIKKLQQGGVGKTASAVTFSAFADELIKIALAPQNLRQALTGGSEYSANALKRKTFKNPIPTIGGATKKVAPIAQAAAQSGVQSMASPSAAGANLKTPNTVDTSAPLTMGTPPASPVHVAPQVNPQAAQIRQGAPQTVNSAVPTSGGAGVQQSSSGTSGTSGKSGQGASA